MPKKKNHPAVPEAETPVHDSPPPDSIGQEEPISIEELIEAANTAIAERDNMAKELDKSLAELEETKTRMLRVAAEYDNFRKRSQREREALFTEIRADTVSEFLPVYDNLERALKTETADAAYKKGVELTMRQLKDVFEKLGVEEIKGEQFDPTYHNAVMHIEDENLGKNTIAEVFQTGFKIGERVIRFSMVKVAN